MATPRRPLQEISSNSTIRKELSPYQRGILVGASRAGTKLSEISQALSVLKLTIHDTLKIDSERDNSKSKPRTGRPFSYSSRDEHKVLRFVYILPKSIYDDIQKECGVDLSTSTLKRILKKYSISN
jgi:hypothetical protein